MRTDKRRLLVGAIAGFAVIACAEEILPPGIVPEDSTSLDSLPVPVGAPRMGTNLDMLNDWSTEWAYTDLFRESRSWISNRTGSAWGTGGPLDLTSDQWVRSLENGQWATS